MANIENAEIDKKEQLDKIIPFLLDNERLHAVYDLKGGGTGFVAITNLRLLMYDKAPMRKKKALTTVPFSRVTSVGCIDSGGFFSKASSELIVKNAAGDEFEFEFWGGEKAQKAYQFIMKELLQAEPA